MRKLPVRKLPARKLLWAAVTGALFLPVQGFTLGLGEIEVNSSLNQRLSADIELLSATPEDSETLIVKLASRKDFTRAGLDRPYQLNDLRFKAVIVNGVPHINVSSSSPIREPFLNFLVEVDWPNGHLLREYTVLLDPPVFMMKQPGAAPVSSAESAGGTGFRPGSGGSANIVPVVIPGASASPRPQAAAVQQPVAVNNSYAAAPSMVTAANQPPGSYRIKSGDTAWSLADAMRPDQSVSVEQMMIAMLRANPESFIDENINGLKRGYILRTPDYDQIASISQADARALVREQAALWRQIQKARSGGQPVSAMPAQGSAAAGDYTAGAAGSDNAYLEIVSAGSGSSAGGAKDPTKMSAEELRAELAIARERVETERVEKEALQQRIQLLESNVDTMKGMLSIEDDGLSGAQALNAPAGEDTAVMQDDSGLTAEEIAARQELLEAMEGESLESQPLDAQSGEDMAVEDAMVDAESALSEAADAETMAGEEAVFVDEAAATDESVDMPADSAAAPVAPAPVIDRPEPDPLTKLLGDPILLAAAGGGLLLVVALIALLIKRRKSATADSGAEAAPAAGVDDLESLADDVAAEAEGHTGESDAGDDLVDILADTAQGDTGEFDSDSTMVLNSPEDTIIGHAEEAVEEEIEDEPRDDVIAEADVYLAYGIYQQAEELLTQAIADNPDRDDYRVKLAETHYASKDVEAFKQVAGDIRQRAASDDVPAWKKIMVMGQDLCPDEAMFQGSMIGGVDVDSLAPKAPEMDFDLGINEAESEVTPDLDLSLDDELELPDMDEGSTQILDADDLVMDSPEVPTDEDVATDKADDEAVLDAVDEIEFDISDAGAVEQTADAEDEFSLDIDASELDIDIQDDVAEEESIEIDDIDIGLDLAEEADASADEEHPVDDIDIDFGLDDAADEAVAEDKIEEGADDEIEIDLTDESASLDMDFGEMESDSSLDAGEAAEPEIDISMDMDDVSADDIELDSADADLDAKQEAEAEQAIAAEPAEAEEESAVETAADNSMEDDFDLSSLDDVDEVSTKLDLARAYLDMGDHEGSRGILEEVIAEGNDEQKKEADELMAKLD